MISVHVWLMRVKTLDRLGARQRSASVDITTLSWCPVSSAQDKHNTLSFLSSDQSLTCRRHEDQHLCKTWCRQVWAADLYCRAQKIWLIDFCVSSGFSSPPSSLTPSPGLTESRPSVPGLSGSWPGPRSSRSLAASDRSQTPSSTSSSWLTPPAVTDASFRGRQGEVDQTLKCANLLLLRLVKKWPSKSPVAKSVRPGRIPYSQSASSKLRLHLTPITKRGVLPNFIFLDAEQMPGYEKFEKHEIVRWEIFSSTIIIFSFSLNKIIPIETVKLRSPPTWWNMLSLSKITPI